MTRSELIDSYFNWMYQLVFDTHMKSRSYRKLFRYLYSIDFTYSHPMDSNRLEDGEDLRYRFAYEHDISQVIVATMLDDRPCSVLEMMIALAVRCEETIMSEPELGDRTSVWFWNMMDSLGLYDMSDSHFNESRVDEIIFRWLNRDYSPDGQGGLFTINNCDEDLRTVEIWCQLCWYLNTYY